jgi:hypothetical protein
VQVLFVCEEQVDMTREDLPKTSVGVSVFVPTRTVLSLSATVAPSTAKSDELGLMLFTNADRGSGKRGGATQDTELKLLLVV